MKEVEFLEMIIAKQSFGIEINAVRELSDAFDTTSVPNSHPSIEGIYESRGETITVVNMRNCLGFDATYPTKGEFVIINSKDAIAALHIDSVANIHRVPEEKLLPAGKVNNNKIIKDVVKIQDRLVTLLDIDKIIDEIIEE